MAAVRVPASTANLGPGFDALGMALGLHAWFGDAPPEPTERARPVDEHHPASAAFTAAGGTGPLWVRSPIPIGRGLGFSGAMRVGGAALAVVQRRGPAGLVEHRAEVLAVAAGLEGHADNAAASVFGGIVATDGASAVRVPTPLDPDVVMWIPDETTSTAASRAGLGATVPFADAVFNVTRTALLVAALAAGDVAALAAATADRLHQPARLAAAPASAAALDAGLAAGAWCGWLSGSGPAVALLTARGDGPALAASLPTEGHTKVLDVDRDGVAALGAVAS